MDVVDKTLSHEGLSDATSTGMGDMRLHEESSAQSKASESQNRVHPQGANNMLEQSEHIADVSRANNASVVPRAPMLEHFYRSQADAEAVHGQTESMVTESMNTDVQTIPQSAPTSSSSTVRSNEELAAAQLIASAMHNKRTKTCKTCQEEFHYEKGILCVYCILYNSI